jgi:hypothetical protein
MFQKYSSALKGRRRPSDFSLWTFRRFFMKVRRFVCSLAGALALAALWLSFPQSRAIHAQTHAALHDGTQAGALVNVVREVTERFRDVRVAEAEGYALKFGCVSGGEYGAMGLHYVNFALVLDGGVLDPTRPEIVIYEPLPNGRLRLVGADYLVLASDWHSKNQAPPELIGQLLHLFESPNRFGLPTFYTLHVWAWKDNPTGTFSNWHAKVSCDAFGGGD